MTRFPVAVPVKFTVTWLSSSTNGLASVYDKWKLMFWPHVTGGLGASTVKLGGVLSIVTVALGPAAGAGVPPRFVAVPAASEIASDPSPVMPLIVTVRLTVPLPLTDTVPFAVPVLIKVTSAGDKVTDVAPVYVMGKVISPVFVIVLDGAPIEIDTTPFDTVNGVLGPAPAAVLPAVSLAVPAAIEIASVPSPVMPLTVTVRVAVPVPVTLTVPFAVPVFTRVTLPAARPTESAPV